MCNTTKLVFMFLACIISISMDAQVKAQTVSLPSCPPGSHYVTKSDGSVNCVQCPPGSFSAAWNSTDFCLGCPAGSFSAVSGSSSCAVCGVGVYTPSGATQCFDCPQGTFQPTQGANQCQWCAPGRYTNTPRATSCTPCAAGSYQDQPRFTSCKACQTGAYMNTTGASICLDCPIGTYQDQQGTSSCVACPIGTYTNQLHQSSCSQCKTGQYQPNTGTTSCLFCSAGSYQPQLGSTSCTLCPAGQYQSSGDATSCFSCFPGQYSAQPGTVKCSVCAPGWYSSESGSTACTPCPTGTYNALAQSHSCTPCPQGQYNSKPGSTSCTQVTTLFPPGGYTRLSPAQLYDSSSSLQFSAQPFSGNSDRTITAWVFQADNTQEHMFWGQNAAGGPCDAQELSLGFVPNMGFWGTACNVNSAAGPAPGTAYPVGQWHHVAFTWNSASQTAQVFVNAQPGNPVNWGRPLTTATDRVVIGARVRSDKPNVNGLAAPWQGVVSSVTGYSQVLTADLINTDMNGGTTPTPVLHVTAQVTPVWSAGSGSGSGSGSLVWQSGLAVWSPSPSTYTSFGGHVWESDQAPTTIVPSGDSDRTITAWVYLNNNQTLQTFWGQNSLYGPCDSDELSMGFMADVGFWGTACNVALASGPAPPASFYPPNRWYHVTFTWNSQTHQAQVYVNGTPGNTLGWGQALTTANDRVVIGARLRTDIPSVNGLANPWLGTVASVNTYSQVLTPDQIIQDMNGNNPLSVTPIMQINAQVTNVAWTSS